MPEQQNWRQEIDMFDYLSHQKKATQVADRRPVIRKPSDLVGPGIAQQAIRVTDWNNVLATFNGYFSSISAVNGPQSVSAGLDENPYSGFVVSDGEYGGKQVITDLNTLIDYTRIFRRAPTDPNTISWGMWFSSSDAPASAFAFAVVGTSIPSGAGLTPLNCPTLGGSNWESTYEQAGTSLNILRDGVYTGVLRVKTNLAGGASANVSVTFPKGLSTESRSYAVPYNTWFDQSGMIPFTFVSLQDSASITVSANHTFGGSHSINWEGMDITRVGGAV